MCWDLQGGTGLNTCAPKAQLKSACFGVGHTEFLKGAERPGKTGANQSLRGYRSNMCFSKGGGEGLLEEMRNELSWGWEGIPELKRRGEEHGRGYKAGLRLQEAALGMRFLNHLPPSWSLCHKTIPSSALQAAAWSLRPCRELGTWK